MTDQPENPQPAPAAEEDAQTAQVAREILEELLGKMSIPATVSPSWEGPEEEGAAPTLTLDVEGDDLSLLLGRKGETLAALQYVARLLAGKELSRNVNLVIDVAGFRRRRRDQLNRMADKCAEQARERGRTITLEPMPPDERRMIHLRLRDHPHVRTESTGEGTHRKVTIIPKSA
jgi:spoIIIJ-associated protein